MIKLLQVVTDLSFVGGDHVYIRKLIRHLKRAHPGEFDIHLVEIRDHDSGEDHGVYAELEDLGVSLHSIQREGTSYLAFGLPRFISRVIAYEGIDVAHSHIFAADLAVAACRAGSTSFLRELASDQTSADLDVLDLIINSGITDLAEIYLDMLPGRGAAEARYLAPAPHFGWISTKHLGALKSICQEQDLEKLFQSDPALRARGYSLNRGLQQFVSAAADIVVTISTLAAGIWSHTNRDVRFIPVACIGNKEWSAIEAARKISRDNPTATIGTTFAFVGRLARKKNPILLIQAFKQHLISFPNDRLVVIGGGRLLDACRMAAGGAEQISFRGHILPAEVLSALSEVDALCLFSSEEGLPLVVQESMASSVPVLASRAGGIPDLIEHRVSGLLTDEVSEKAIAGILAGFSRLSESERRAMSEAARSAIASWTTEEQAFETYVSAYRELAGIDRRTMAR